jgi:hypothetical protein
VRLVVFGRILALVVVVRLLGRSTILLRNSSTHWARIVLYMVLSLLLRVEGARLLELRLRWLVVPLVVLLLWRACLWTTVHALLRIWRVLVLNRRVVNLVLRRVIHLLPWVVVSMWRHHLTHTLRSLLVVSLLLPLPLLPLTMSTIVRRPYLGLFSILPLRLICLLLCSTLLVKWGGIIIRKY